MTTLMSRTVANGVYRLLCLSVLSLALAIIPNLAFGQLKASLWLTPKSVAGGVNSSGLVTLVKVAPAGGLTINLQSNSAAALVPSTINIPSGELTGTFTIATSPVYAQVVAKISANINGQGPAANLTINPPKLGALSFSPNTLTGGAYTQVTLTMQSQAPGSGATVKFTSTTSAWGGPASISYPGGATTASFMIGTQAVSASKVANVTAKFLTSSASASLTIKAPSVASLTLDADTVAGGAACTGTVTLNAAAPKGGINVGIGSTSPSATVPAKVTLPIGATSASFTVQTKKVTKKTTATISATTPGSTFKKTLTIVAINLSGLSLSPTNLTGGSNSAGTVTISDKAPTGGVKIGLATSLGTTSVPSSVTVAAGNTTTSFVITTEPVAIKFTAKITATLGTASITDSLNINPPTLSGFTVAPSLVQGGNPSVGTATLTGNAPVGGTQIQLSSNKVSAMTPASCTVPAGSSSTQFNIGTSVVNSQVLATITGTDPFLNSLTAQLTLVAASGLAPSAWPKFRGNALNTGLGAAAANLGHLVWNVLSNVSTASSIAIAADGTLYVGGSDGILYALNSTGTTKWTFATGGLINSSPAVSTDGTIYIGSTDSYLYAVSPTGTLKWRFETGGEVESSPTVGKDGTIYFGSDDGRLYALTPGGTELWGKPVNNYATSSPAIGADGTIYIGSQDYSLYAFSPQGDNLWTFPTGRPLYGAPAIGSDGTIYVASDQIYAVNPNGTQKWVANTQSDYFNGVALDANDTVIAADSMGTLFSYSKTGVQNWNIAIGTGFRSSPVIDSNGVIYTGSFDNDLYAINANGTKKWSYATASPIVSSVAIGSDGTLYFGSTGFYALK